MGSVRETLLWASVIAVGRVIFPNTWSSQRIVHHYIPWQILYCKYTVPRQYLHWEPSLIISFVNIANIRLRDHRVAGRRWVFIGQLIGSTPLVRLLAGPGAGAAKHIRRSLLLPPGSVVCWLSFIRLQASKLFWSNLSSWVKGGQWSSH